MRTVGAILFVFVVATCCGQEEATFTVKANHSIFLSPDIDTLLADSKYIFKISGSGAKDVADIKFTGGTVLINDSVVTVQTAKTVVLSKKYSLLLLSKRNNVYKELLSKNFTILPPLEKPVFNPNFILPKAPFNFNWLRFNSYSGSDTFSVESFSRADKRIFASHPYANPAENRVVFFKLSFNNKGTTQTLISINGQVTDEMTKQFQIVSAGSMITLSEVRCKGIKEFPDDVILGPFKIFIKE